MKLRFWPEKKDQYSSSTISFSELAVMISSSTSFHILCPKPITSILLGSVLFSFYLSIPHNEITYQLPAFPLCRVGRFIPVLEMRKLKSDRFGNFLRMTPRLILSSNQVFRFQKPGLLLLYRWVLCIGDFSSYIVWKVFYLKKNVLLYYFQAGIFLRYVIYFLIC